MRELGFVLCVLLLSPAPGAAQEARPACGRGPRADYHVHLKGDLTLEDALRRSREDGITYGIAINGGLGFADDDAALEAFLAQVQGLPVFAALQGEGREWVRLFSPAVLARFDYVFTDAMTWTDDRGRRMRLWMPDEVGTIEDPEAFMDLLVARATTIFAREPIDLYVNPTYVPDQLAAQAERLWTPARIQRLVDALAKHGVALEINNRRRLPGLPFLRLARAAGVRLACGTNNAGAADLGHNEYCAEVTRTLELRDEDFWCPPADGHKAVQRRPLPR